MRLSPVFSRSCLAAAGLALALPAAVAPARAASTGSGGPTEPRGYREVFSPDGHPHLVKARTDHPPKVGHQRASTVTTIQKTGPDANRFVLVVVGDGYTSAQQATYDKQAAQLMSTLFSVAPYKQYKKLFNIYRVNVTSAVSGITGALSQASKLVTPLGMHFYCNGIERLLCTDQAAATHYAAQASSMINAIVAIGNTTKYGGSGGTLTTVAGGNASAGQILPHEMGHTTGKLGDDYDYPYDTAGGGPEPTYPNISRYSAATIKQKKLKWYRWLGTTSPSGGKIGAYQGANYYKKGYTRPSQDGLMRTLGKPFDPVDREAMIVGFWRNVHLIDANAWNGGPRARSSTLWVTKAPVTLTTTWWMDGKYVKGSSGKTKMRISALKPSAGKKHTITVWVKDPTKWVIDPAAKSTYMAQKVTWTVKP